MTEKKAERMSRRQFLGIAGAATGVAMSDRSEATVPTGPIPIFVHLMKNRAPRFESENTAVANVLPVLQTLFEAGNNGNTKTVNAVWKVAELKFAIQDNDEVFYTDDDIHDRDNIVPGRCDPREEDLVLFRTLQQKFGRAGFRGLQIYVWSNIAAGVGCGVSNRPMPGFGPYGRTRPGAIFVDSVGLLDPSGRPAVLLAHEIGHFLGVQHPNPPVDFASGRLMHPRFPGPKLMDDEIELAKDAAQRLMEGRL